MTLPRFPPQVDNLSWRGMWAFMARVGQPMSAKVGRFFINVLRGCNGAPWRSSVVSLRTRHAATLQFCFWPLLPSHASHHRSPCEPRRRWRNGASLSWSRRHSRGRRSSCAPGPTRRISASGRASTLSGFCRGLSLSCGLTLPVPTHVYQHGVLQPLRWIRRPLQVQRLRGD